MKINYSKSDSADSQDIRNFSYKDVDEFMRSVSTVHSGPPDSPGDRSSEWSAEDRSSEWSEIGTPEVRCTSSNSCVFPLDFGDDVEGQKKDPQTDLQALPAFTVRSQTETAANCFPEIKTGQFFRSYSSESSTDELDPWVLQNKRPSFDNNSECCLVEPCSPSEPEVNLNKPWTQSVSHERQNGNIFHVTNHGNVKADAENVNTQAVKTLPLPCIVEIPEEPTREKQGKRSSIPTDLQPKQFKKDKGQMRSKKIATLSSYRDTVSKLIKNGSRKQKRNHLILKNGSRNIMNTNVQKRGIRFILDTFTTILDLHWCFLLLIFCFAFMLSWIGFALVWWIISYVHNDHIHTTDEDWEPCAAGVYDFHTALLFSVETQHTIGYGTRAVTRACPIGLIVMMLQSLAGVLITAMFTGLIFAKFARSKQRRETIMFSKTAVICETDGCRCLVIRVADLRKSYMIGVNIRAILIQTHTTLEGECNPIRQKNLHLSSEAEDFFFLAWPMKLVHVINESSPLWTVTAEELLMKDFEIVVVLEGVNPTTGQTTQVCTSYLPAEVSWGHRFTPLLTEKKKDGFWSIDYTRFHDTKPVDMSDESAQARSYKTAFSVE